MIESNISPVAISDLWKKDIDGSLPILIDIYNPDIKWDDGSSGEFENCHLRLINDTNMVKYKGKFYLPNSMTVQLPTTDGAKIGTASVTISAIDSSIVKILRELELPSKVTVMAAYMKFDATKYKFFELKKIEFDMNMSSYNTTAATLTLTYDSSLQRNFPVDTATKDRLPSVRD